MLDVLSVILDGLIYSSWLYIIAIGLTLVYGVMKILNMAHGSLYALGAYAAVVLVGKTITEDGSASLMSFVMIGVAAIVVGVVAGPVIERGIFRFLYGKDEVLLLLVTFAISLILEDGIKLVWGVESYSISAPANHFGNFEFHNGDLLYQKYSFLLVLVAVAVGLLLQWALKGTRKGKLLLAVIHDREVSTALGINVKMMYLVTFSVGAILAAIGGAMTAPTVAVVPSMGAEVIVLAFAVVVIGGLGSLVGAALGAFIVGMVRSGAVHYYPQVELFSIYFVMALVLLIKPKGLFSGVEARKI